MSLTNSLEYIKWALVLLLLTFMKEKSQPFKCFLESDRIEEISLFLITVDEYKRDYLSPEDMEASYDTLVVVRSSGKISQSSDTRKSLMESHQQRKSLMDGNQQRKSQKNLSLKPPENTISQDISKRSNRIFSSKVVNEIQPYDDQTYEDKYTDRLTETLDINGLEREINLTKNAGFNMRGQESPNLMKLGFGGQDANVSEMPSAITEAKSGFLSMNDDLSLRIGD